MPKTMFHTQLYMQAGNSVTASVVEAMLNYQLTMVGLNENFKTKNIN